MSVLDEHYWSGRVGQECRRICELADEAEREGGSLDWVLVHHHVKTLSYAYAAADLPGVIGADLNRAIGNTMAEHAVSSASYRVFRRAAEKF